MYHSNLKRNTTRTKTNMLLTPQYSSTSRIVPYCTRLTEHSSSHWPTQRLVYDLCVDPTTDHDPTDP